MIPWKGETMIIETILVETLGKNISVSSDREIYEALLTIAQEMAEKKESNAGKKKFIMYQQNFLSESCSPTT